MNIKNTQKKTRLTPKKNKRRKKKSLKKIEEKKKHENEDQHDPLNSQLMTHWKTFPVFKIII
jgi:hypothetical protein